MYHLLNILNIYKHRAAVRVYSMMVVLYHCITITAAYASCAISAGVSIDHYPADNMLINYQHDILYDDLVYKAQVSILELHKAYGSSVFIRTSYHITKYLETLGEIGYTMSSNIKGDNQDKKFLTITNRRIVQVSSPYFQIGLLTKESVTDKIGIYAGAMIGIASYKFDFSQNNINGYIRDKENSSTIELRDLLGSQEFLSKKTVFYTTEIGVKYNINDRTNALFSLLIVRTIGNNTYNNNINDDNTLSYKIRRNALSLALEHIL